MLGEDVLYYLLWKTKHHVISLSTLHIHTQRVLSRATNLLKSVSQDLTLVELSTGRALPAEGFTVG